MKNKTNEELLLRVAELEKEISFLKKRKKYGLVWEDKPEEFDAITKNAFPVLEKKSKGSLDILFDGTEKNNILIEGDNYHSLSVLTYTHREKVDVIYIDPPYNTGNKSWRYNNDYVDKDDIFRHSKWLSFMSKRLSLAKKLLSKDGVLICTIDHTEQENLGLLLKEIFPHMAIVCVTIVHNPAGVQGDNFSYSHENAYFVFPKGGRFIGQQVRSDENSDVRNFRDVTGDSSLRTAGANCFYPIFVKDGEIIGFGDVCNQDFHPEGVNSDAQKGVVAVYPIDPQGVERKWRFARDTVEGVKSELRAKYISSRGIWDIIRIKNSFNFKTVWTDSKYSSNNYGIQILNQILDKGSFDYPKSIHAVKDCIIAASNEKDNIVILDFFAGSGTTGQAVLELNKEDGGERTFILCTNNENGICEQVTYERIKRVMTGYKNNKGEKVNGLGGNLKYLKTDFIPKDIQGMITDEDKLRLTYEAGLLLALKEDTFDEVKKTKSFQIFSSNKKITGVYFSENKEYLSEFLEILSSSKKIAKAYIFSWDKGAYKNAFPEFENILFEDIPDPILEVYKQLV